MIRRLPRFRGRIIGTRPASDPHVLLAVAVSLAALIIELTATRDAIAVVIPLLVYVALQIGLGVRRSSARSPHLDLVRLLIALGTVFWMTLQVGEGVALPLTSLYIPVVAMAAARGTRPGVVLGGAAMAAYLLPVISAPVVDPGNLQRGVAMVASMTLIGVGTRQTIAQLERVLGHARTSMASQLRRARQMAAVETVGRTLATHGPSRAALVEIVDLLVARFEYRFVSIYTADGPVMRLGAHHGYTHVIETFDGSTGVIGRVMRTGRPELVRDITTDPEYASANPGVCSEVSVPLVVGNQTLGVLNVESTADRPLDEGDRDTMILVGDRLASALALAWERKALRERADLFDRLARFGSAINASLEAGRVHESIISAVSEVLATDVTVLTLRESDTGLDRIVAIRGGEARYVGATIPPGEGMSGRAIAERNVVTEASMGRASFPSTVRGAQIPDVLVAAAFPLIKDERVLGAVAITRHDLGRPFSALEIEAMPLLASQITLALANVELHAQVADAAIRDPLTGLWNRRQLEVSTDRLFAARARLQPDHRHPVAIIFFDLDHFGSFNKRHGHVTGDAVLRAFGAILARRLRSSDIVARFGGEEFVAILDGAKLDEAQRLADQIRRELESLRIEGVDGEDLQATVSAGCASLGPDVASLETLLEVADVALQMAKRGGRNQVVAA